MQATNRLLMLFTTAAMMTGCGVHGSRAPLDRPEGFVVTAEQIQKTGARNAWDALRLSGAPISFTEDGKGEPQRVRKRGNSSISLSNTPLLVVDEVRMSDVRYLRDIPAPSVAMIRVVNGTTGTARYGTGGGNGVIIVTTR